MKVLVCGNITDYQLFSEGIRDSGLRIEELLCAKEENVNSLVSRYCREHKLRSMAYMIDKSEQQRNERMVAKADAIIVFGESEICKNLKIPENIIFYY